MSRVPAMTWCCLASVVVSVLALVLVGVLLLLGWAISGTER